MKLSIRSSAPASELPPAPEPDYRCMVCQAEWPYARVRALACCRCCGGSLMKVTPAAEPPPPLER